MSRRFVHLDNAFCVLLAICDSGLSSVMLLAVRLLLLLVALMTELGHRVLAVLNTMVPLVTESESRVCGSLSSFISTKRIPLS